MPQPAPPSAAATDEFPARSPHHLPRATFNQLFNLSRQQRWLEKRQEQLSDLFDLCIDGEEQELVLDLLYRFFSVNSDELPAVMEQCAEFCLKALGAEPTSTIFVAPERSSYADSSQAILWYMKAALGKFDGWNTTKFVSRLGDAPKHAPSDGLIVLIEEFVGSGTTATKHAVWLRKRLEEQNIKSRIHVLALTAMQESARRLTAESIEHHAMQWLSRGISDHFSGAELERAIRVMERIETRLCDKSDDGRLRDMYFGYKRSEALYFFDGGNGANNVFPIFWWKWLKPRIRRRPLIDRAQ